MSNKLHDLLRILQWLIPALATFYGVLDRLFCWGLMGYVETITSALIALIGVVAQHSSHTYFETKTIVTKILQDSRPEQVEE